MLKDRNVLYTIVFVWSRESIEKVKLKIENPTFARINAFFCQLSILISQRSFAHCPLQTVIAIFISPIARLSWG